MKFMKAQMLNGQELELVLESIENSLMMFEDDYFDLDEHDTPEEWVMFRQTFNGWAGLYERFTGAKWMGQKGIWDARGVHRPEVVTAGDADEVTEGG